MSTSQQPPPKKKEKKKKKKRVSAEEQHRVWQVFSGDVCVHAFVCVCVCVRARARAHSVFWTTHLPLPFPTIHVDDIIMHKYDGS